MKALIIIFALLATGNGIASSSMPRTACLAVVQDSALCTFKA